MKENHRILSALRACFPSTLPVMTGYVFLGITYGILMVNAGFPGWLPVVMALILYTGSMEFLMVEILASSFHPLSAFVTALMVGARHIFYGLAMLPKYRNMGWKKFYLIYSTSDETFAVNYAAEIPDGIDHSWYYFWTSLLDQLYWVGGAAIGVLCGSLIRFQVDGLGFVMTAMFLVILMDQWLKDGTKWKTIFRDHICELTGIGASVICLLIFGPNNFIIPSMLMILLVLTILRPKLEKSGQQSGYKKAGIEEKTDHV